jgi:hypothetical protein
MSNPNSTSSSISFGTKLIRFFVRLIVFLTIISLAALVAYLLSKENTRTFSLHIVDDMLVINKGKFLPIGSSPWNTEDEAYAKLPLEGFKPQNTETSKYKREELDQALFPILESLAKPRILSEDSANQERGIYYLSRAELLAGLTKEQQNALKTLRAEASFYRAKTRLPEAELFMKETLAQFELATHTPNKNTVLAASALSVLEPALKQLSLAIQEVLAASPPAALEENTPETPPPPPGSPPEENTPPNTQNIVENNEA